MIRVVVVSTVRLNREGLANALAVHPDIAVLGTAAGLAGIEQFLALDPEIVVVQAPLGEGTALLHAIASRRPDIQAVALASSEAEEDLVLWAEAGATAFVPHDQSLEELAETLRAVARGEVPCTPAVAAALVRRVRVLAAERRSALGGLTTRETEIVGLLGEGLTNKEIARRLFISVPTVKSHVHNILEKLDVHRRAEVADWARARQLGAASAPRLVGGVPPGLAD